MSGIETRLSRPLKRATAAERLGQGTMGGMVRRRPTPTARAIARRRFIVGSTKWLLPLFAVLLLGSIAAWPEITRVSDQGRVAFRRAFQVDPDSGQMLKPRYRGIDERSRPYTVTAATAQQTSSERIALTQPKGDLTTESGTWIYVEAKEGVFIQHRSLMDLSHDVSLYREDGTVLQSDTAALDLKAGVATSADKTHAEGPFGILDSQGFTLTDKGAVIQFAGPAHGILNAAEKKPETSK